MRAGRRSRFFILACAAALAGCHDGGDGADAGLDLGSSCSGSLSGAVSETILGCKVTWHEQSGAAEIGNDGNLDVSDPSRIADFSRFGFVLGVNGDARAGTFSMANVNSYAAGVFVQSDGGTAGYIANFSSNPTGPPKLGSVSAQITSAVLDFSSGPTSQWILHGSVNANLVPAPMSGAMGTVQLAIVF